MNGERLHVLPLNYTRVFETSRLSFESDEAN